MPLREAAARAPVTTTARRGPDSRALPMGVWAAARRTPGGTHAFLSYPDGAKPPLVPRSSSHAIEQTLRAGSEALLAVIVAEDGSDAGFRQVQQQFAWLRGRGVHRACALLRNHINARVGAALRRDVRICRAALR